MCWFVRSIGTNFQWLCSILVQIFYAFETIYWNSIYLHCIASTALYMSFSPPPPALYHSFDNTLVYCFKFHRVIFRKTWYMEYTQVYCLPNKSFATKLMFHSFKHFLYTLKFYGQFLEVNLTKSPSPNFSETVHLSC